MGFPKEFCVPQVPDDFYLEYLKNNFHYNPNTGLLYRKGRDKPIGSKNDRGYLVTRLGPFKNRNEKRHFKVHHICWFFIDSQFIWPENEIDHKNRIRSDNRAGNLEITDRKTNLERRIFRDNNPF